MCTSKGIQTAGVYAGCCAKPTSVYGRESTLAASVCVKTAGMYGTACRCVRDSVYACVCASGGVYLLYRPDPPIHPDHGYITQTTQ